MVTRSPATTPTLHRADKAPPQLVPAGSLPQLEALLGFPPWFRDGTELGPSGSPFSERIALADDLQIIANICRHGAISPVLTALICAPRVPQSRGWNAAMATAPSLDDALALLVARIPASNPYLRITVAMIDGRVVIASEVADYVPDQAVPLVAMAALLLLCRHVTPYGFGTMQHCMLEVAAPPDEALLAVQRHMGTPLRFGCDAYRLSFPANWLARPNPDADPDLWRLQVNKLAGWCQPLGPLAETLCTIVRACLEQGKQPPSLASTAATLGMSERTLVRRLTQAGTSYLRLVDAERRNMATRLIADPTLSLQQIADRLAYADRQGFARAFRQWFGESPGCFRRRLRGGHYVVA